MDLKEEDVRKVEELVKETLEEVAEKDFKGDIHSAVNTIEDRELNTGSFPRCLALLSVPNQNWNYGKSGRRFSQDAKTLWRHRNAPACLLCAPARATLQTLSRLRRAQETSRVTRWAMLDRLTLGRIPLVSFIGTHHKNQQETRMRLVNWKCSSALFIMASAILGKGLAKDPASHV